MINSVNTETRRKSERTKVASSEIVYLHFQTGNGGIVLDVSAEGLGFQAADPIQAAESLSFRLSVTGFPEIALSGQIMWLDSTRKRGGMRLSVPAESVKLFQQWQRKYVDSAAEPNEFPLPAKPNQAPAVASQSASRTESRAENRIPPPPQAARVAESQPPSAAPAPQPEPPRTSPPPPPNPFARRADSILGAHGPIFVSEWETPPEPSRTGRNILIACVVIGICAVVAGGSYYLTGKRAVGNMLINLGQQIGGANTRARATAPTHTGGSPAAVTGAPETQPPSLPQAAVPNSAPSASPATAPDAQAPGTASPPQLPAGAGAANSTTPKQAATTSAAPEASGASTPTGQQGDPQNESSDAAAPPPNAHPPSSSHSATALKRAPEHATATADDGGAELNEALVYLRSANSQDSEVAEELLWSAVGKGNTQADLVLGDLYMRGQGAVRRNCRQAEVLLHAALVADVPGADEKIGEMQTYGCH